MLVYVVEDDPVIRRSLLTVLKTVEAVELVGWADCEADAKSFLAGYEQWGCLILDLQLLEGSGFGVLKSISSRPDHHHVVVFSNAATKQNRDLCALLGADAFYDKTLEFDQFIKHIESIV